MDNVPAVVEPRAMRPADEVAFASDAARVLVDIVKKNKLSKKFGGEKEHIYFEAWATVAKFYGCTIKATDAVPTSERDENGRFYGYKGTAIILDADGKEMGGATAFCERDEANWRSKSNFALASMAQTRAGAKAARMKFSWVVVLAGYSPTPVEEMPEDENGKPAPEPHPSSPTSMKQFLAAMADLKKEAGDEVYYGILAGHGVKHANELKARELQVAAYKELMKAIEGLKAASEVFETTEE